MINKIPKSIKLLSLAGFSCFLFSCNNGGTGSSGGQLTIAVPSPLSISLNGNQQVTAYLNGVSSSSSQTTTVVTFTSSNASYAYFPSSNTYTTTCNLIIPANSSSGSCQVSINAAGSGVGYQVTISASTPNANQGTPSSSVYVSN